MNFQVTTVSGEHGASQELDREAKMWATRIAKENRAIRTNTKKLEVFQEQLASGKKVRIPSLLVVFCSICAPNVTQRPLAALGGTARGAFRTSIEHGNWCKVVTRAAARCEHLVLKSTDWSICDVCC